LETARAQWLAEKDSLTQKLATVKSGHSDSDAQVDRLKRDLATATADLAAVRENATESAAKFTASETVRRDYGNQLNAVQTQLKETQTSLESVQAQASGLIDENSRLKAQLNISRSGELETLRAQISAAELHAAEVQKSNLVLTEENTRLKSALAGVSTAVVHVAPTRANGIALAPPTRPASDVPAGVNPPTRLDRSTVIAATAPAKASATTTAAPRRHTVVSGDTLRAIALRYYGNPNRWPEILAANRDVLHDERSLTIGRILRIP
jgi:nucleoid-associated protein YgaU